MIRKRKAHGVGHATHPDLEAGSFNISRSYRLFCSHITAKTNPVHAQSAILQLLDSIGVDLADVVSTWIASSNDGVVIDFTRKDKRDSAVLKLR